MKFFKETEKRVAQHRTQQNFLRIQSVSPFPRSYASLCHHQPLSNLASVTNAPTPPPPWPQILSPANYLQAQKCPLSIYPICYFNCSANQQEMSFDCLKGQAEGNAYINPTGGFPGGRENELVFYFLFCTHLQTMKNGSVSFHVPLPSFAQEGARFSRQRDIAFSGRVEAVLLGSYHLFED